MHAKEKHAKVQESLYLSEFYDIVKHFSMLSLQFNELLEEIYINIIKLTIGNHSKITAIVCSGRTDLGAPLKSTDLLYTLTCPHFCLDLNRLCVKACMGVGVVGGQVLCVPETQTNRDEKKKRLAKLACFIKSFCGGVH